MASIAPYGELGLARCRWALSADGKQLLVRIRGTDLALYDSNAKFHKDTSWSQLVAVLQSPETLRACLAPEERAVLFEENGPRAQLRYEQEAAELGQKAISRPVTFDAFAAFAESAPAPAAEVAPAK